MYCIIHAPSTCQPVISKEAPEFPGARVMDRCRLWEQNPCALPKWQVLLATKLLSNPALPLLSVLPSPVSFFLFSSVLFLSLPVFLPSLVCKVNCLLTKDNFYKFEIFENIRKYIYITFKGIHNHEDREIFFNAVMITQQVPAQWRLI